MLRLLWCVCFCTALLRTTVEATTGRPVTDNVCVIRLIGAVGSTKKPTEHVGAFELVSFNCTGIKLPVPIRVHPSLFEAVTFQEGVELISDAEVRGLIQFEDIRSLAIVDSVFERLIGGGLAPVVFDRSAGLFYGCRFANNAYARTGGIYVSGGSFMHVYDSIFEGNRGVRHGAVMTTNGCRVLFRNTQFLGNKGGKHETSASGFVSGAFFAFQSTLTEFEGCEWKGNEAVGAGAGAFMGVKRAVVNFTQCTIESNAGTAGAISLADLSTGRMTETKFLGNHGRTDGAPIDLILGSKLTVIECALLENKGVSGVIIARDSSELYMTSSTFSGNIGTMYSGSVSSLRGGCIHIDECTFTSNTGAFGGAVYQNRARELNVMKTEFKGNTATFSGGALFQKDVETTTLSQCVFSDNDGGAVGGGVSQLGCGVADWLTPTQLDMVTCEDTTASNCIIVKITGCSFEGNSATLEGSSIFHDRCKTLIIATTTSTEDDSAVVQKRCEKREFMESTPTDVSLLNCPDGKADMTSHRRLLSPN